MNSPVADPAPCLTLHDYSLRYAGALVPALRGISLQLHAGSCLGVVGESGSGKSSLALGLIGLLPEQTLESGQLTWLGTDLIWKDQVRWRALRGHVVGYVFQDAAASLHPLRSIGAQLQEMLCAETKVGAALREVGLPDDAEFQRRRPHQISGGQRQRVMIALALSTSPQVLICDEPTSALDAIASAGILQLLQQLQQQRRLAVVLISHDLDAVASVADDLLVLRGGEVQAQGACAEVLRCTNTYVRLLCDSRPRLDDNPARLGLPETTPMLRSEPGSLQIEVAGLQVQRAGKIALRDIRFQLRRGQTLGVIGASGSGKSTLARALLQLLPAAASVMSIAGSDPRRLNRDALRMWRRRVQIVFQDPGTSLDPLQSVRDVIGEGLDLHRLTRSRAEREARIADLLRAVSLSADFLDRRPHQLSGGQQQRVAIARALATDPEVLICDEAISALDVSVQAEILNLLCDLRDQRALSLIFIGHDLAAMRFIADELLVLDRGRIVEAGSTAEVLRNPQHAITRALIQALPERLGAQSN